MFGKLGEVKKYKETNGTIIAIGGCMMQEKHIVGKLKHSYPFFDIVFGTHTLYKFPEDVYNAIVNGKQIEDIIDIDGEVIEGLPIKRDDNIKASVAIMNGCNNFCTYCIVPYVRGRERSRKAEDIIAEVKCLAKEGYKEITLLGQNVNSYMRVEREQNLATGEIDSFAKLLREVNKIDGIERIRLSSLEPTIVDEEFAQRLSKLEKICDHFHLSLQSGCDATLKRMNRKYTTARYKEATEILRKYYPSANFTTDVIVGFPGETDEEFNQTYQFLKEIGFYKMHIFKYSPRKGTVAEKLPNQVDGNIKEERSRKLIELSNNMQNEKNSQYIGKTVKVLFEEFENGFFKGHTTNYMMVKVAGEEEQSDKFVNKILDVKIKENNDETRELIGILS